MMTIATENIVRELLEALKPFAAAYEDQVQYMPESGLNDDDRIVVAQSNCETELMVNDTELLQLGHLANARQIYDVHKDCLG